MLGILRQKQLKSLTEQGKFIQKCEIAYWRVVASLYTNKRTIGYDIRQWLHKCRREGYHMAKTVVKKNESLDDALRRFKRTVSKSGTLAEYRKREFYEKPSVRRKLKSEAARKRKKF